MKPVSKTSLSGQLRAWLMIGWVAASPAIGAEVNIGLNIPLTGPYRVQGIQQRRAANLAAEEINAAGGILGQTIRLMEKDSQSKVDVTTKNVTDMIDRDNVKMVFGGAASSVAIAAGKVAQQKGVPFFGTLTYSTETTGSEGHRFVFRECYDAWMAAKALAAYLKNNFPSGKHRYFYITADYTWGHTTEASIRKFSNTEDKETHKGVLTPFPNATYNDFWNALEAAQKFKPDVLVLVLFGNDMSTALKLAESTGIKGKAQIVVPNITLGMAESAGPEAMQGVIGATPWAWEVPYKYNFQKGKDFVEKFSTKYGTYPSTSAASAYTILYEYKAAVERTRSFEGADVVRALEGHEYQLLKDPQLWRDFDHQSVQTVYAVRGKPAQEVRSDKFKLDYFDIISSMSGPDAVITREEWNAARRAAGKRIELESLN